MTLLTQIAFAVQVTVFAFGWASWVRCWLIQLQEAGEIDLENGVWSGLFAALDRLVRPAVEEVQRHWPDSEDYWAGRVVWFACLVLSFAMLPATWVYFAD